MTFPVFPGKQELEAIVTPAAMLAHRRAGGRLGAIAAPRAAVICLERGLPQRVRSVRLRKVGRLMGDLFVVRASDGRVVVLTDFGLGAPIVAAQAEELIALGATRIVSIALAGGIAADMATGDVVVADAAIRDEGTSHHYLAPGERVSADAALADAVAGALRRRGVAHRRGTTWSTDAPYRETREEAIHYAAQGALVVDMEMAALFAVAQHRGVAAAGVLVAGDSLAGGVWTPPARLDGMTRALDAAYAAIVEVLDA
ncbi:MAG TPA: nucleoside phosphorylase [Ilumatobacteraceae bacterium]